MAEAGIGKTELVLRWLVRPELRGLKVVLAVSDLGLAERLEKRLLAIRTADSPRVIVHRGRGAGCQMGGECAPSTTSPRR